MSDGVTIDVMFDNEPLIFDVFLFLFFLIYQGQLSAFGLGGQFGPTV